MDLQLQLGEPFAVGHLEGFLGATSSNPVQVVAEDDRISDAADDLAGGLEDEQTSRRTAFASSVEGNDARRRLFASLPTRLQRPPSPYRDSEDFRGSSRASSRRIPEGLEAASMPRLELSPNSLTSFKRSFEEATSARRSNTSTSMHAAANLSTATSANSTPSSSSSQTRFQMAESASPDSHPSSAATSPDSHRSSSIDVPLPLIAGFDSPVEGSEPQSQSQGISTALLQHTPPTPSISTRIKRRRSGVAGLSGGTIRPEVANDNHGRPFLLNGIRRDNVTSAPDVPDRLTRSLAPDDPLTNDSRFLETPLPTVIPTSINRREIHENASPLGRWRLPTLPRSTAVVSEEVARRDNIVGSSSNLTRYIDNLLSSEQAQQARAHRSLLEHSHSSESHVRSFLARSEPSAPPSVSTRRGNDTSFDLGPLPRFSFARTTWSDEGTADVISPTSTFAYSRTSIPRTPSPGRLSQSELTGDITMPRRPNLHRNTTAVTPPEESPLNTPDGEEDERRGESVYAGMSMESFCLETDFGTIDEMDEDLYEEEPGDLDGEETDYAVGLDYDMPDDDEPDDFASAHQLSSRNQRIARVRSLTPLELDLPSPILADEDNRAEIGQRGQEADRFYPFDNAIFSSPVSSTSDEDLSQWSGEWNIASEARRAENLTELIEHRRNIASHVESLQTRPGAESASSGQPSRTVPDFVREEGERGHHRSISEQIGLDRPAWHVPFDWRTGFGESAQTRHISQRAQRVAPDPEDASASASMSRGLWGQVDAARPLSRNLLNTPISISRPNISTAVTSPTPSTFHNDVIAPRGAVPARRPGSLGLGTVRGPTRTSNEAWLRNQGIDFYDSLGHPATNLRQGVQGPTSGALLSFPRPVTSDSAPLRSDNDLLSNRRSSSSAARSLRRVVARQPLILSQPGSRASATDLLRHIEGTSSRSANTTGSSHNQYYSHGIRESETNNHNEGRSSPQLDALRPISPLFDDDMEQDVELYDLYVPEARASPRPHRQSSARQPHQPRGMPSGSPLDEDELHADLEAGYAIAESQGSLYPHSDLYADRRNAVYREAQQHASSGSTVTDWLDWHPPNGSSPIRHQNRGHIRPSLTQSDRQRPDLQLPSPPGLPSYASGPRLPPIAQAGVLSNAISAPRVSVGHPIPAVASATATTTGSLNNQEQGGTRLNDIRRMLNEVCKGSELEKHVVLTEYLFSA